MSTYKELVYLVSDELKILSDDSYYTNDHILYLLSKYRSFLLKQRYADIKKQIPESNYQTVSIDLNESQYSDDEGHLLKQYLVSSSNIPFIMSFGIPRVYAEDYYYGDIAYVSRDRMRYVGYNKFLQNAIYCSIHPDHNLYLFSKDLTTLQKINNVKVTSIFQDCLEVDKINANINQIDIMDVFFPIEEALISPLIELIIKELSGAKYTPMDENNNATDDMSNIQVKK